MTPSNESFYAIPKTIAEDKNLSLPARMIAGHIATYHRTKSECFASNKKLGEPFGIAEKTVANCLTELRKAGYLTDAGNGKSRRLKVSNLPHTGNPTFPTQGTQPSPHREPNLPHTGNIRD